LSVFAGGTLFADHNGSIVADNPKIRHSVLKIRTPVEPTRPLPGSIRPPRAFLCDTLVVVGDERLPRE
jgi:hypothetical protein